MGGVDPSESHHHRRDSAAEPPLVGQEPHPDEPGHAVGDDHTTASVSELPHLHAVDHFYPHRTWERVPFLRLEECCFL